MTGEVIALELLKLALAAAPAIVEAITGTDAATLDERIDRARLAVRDPIDTSEDDTARRARLGRIIRGEE